MVLTSGPFPAGNSSDVAVEEHLEACDDCWRIAEALRPAHDVFEESVPACEGRDLPGYWGDALPTGTAVAQIQQTAIRTTMLQTVPRRARLQYYISLPAREPIGWWAVARIASFMLLIGSAAIAAAWLMS